jgi:hypothetical protein
MNNSFIDLELENQNVESAVSKQVKLQEVESGADSLISS